MLPEAGISVADPDPHVFGPPGFGSRSIGQRYGSGSGSSSCKNSKENLDSYYFVTLFDFLKKRGNMIQSTPAESYPSLLHAPRGLEGVLHRPDQTRPVGAERLPPTGHRKPVLTEGWPRGGEWQGETGRNRKDKDKPVGAERLPPAGHRKPVLTEGWPRGGEWQGETGRNRTVRPHILENQQN